MGALERLPDAHLVRLDAESGACELRLDAARWTPARLYAAILEGGYRPAAGRFEADGELAVAADGTGTFTADGGGERWTVDGPDGGPLSDAEREGVVALGATVHGRFTGAVPPGPADPPRLRWREFVPN